MEYLFILGLGTSLMAFGTCMFCIHIVKTWEAKAGWIVACMGYLGAASLWIVLLLLKG
jgi:hypothetical protein